MNNSVLTLLVEAVPSQNKTLIQIVDHAVELMNFCTSGW